MSDDLLYSAADFEEGRALTDADGRFSITGLGDEVYVLTTSDLSWALLPVLRPGVRPPQDDIRLVATRTYRIRLRVKDAQDGQPVPSARVRLTLGGGHHTGFAVTDGEADIAFVPQDKAMRDGRGVDLLAQIQAFGYSPTETTLVFPPGERLVEQEVPLWPVALHTYHFRLWAAGGPASGRYRITMTRGGETHAFGLDATDTPGSYSCLVPEGEWQCRVYPEGALSQYIMSWEGDLRVGGATSAPADVSLPVFGQLEVMGWEQGSIGLLVQMAGRRIHTVASAQNHTFFLLEGEWPYEATADGRTLQQGVVEIRAGHLHRLTIKRD